MTWTPAGVHPAGHPGVARTLARTAVARRTGTRARFGGQAGAGAHLRLTRRGRVVVLLALVTLLLAAFSLGRVGTEAAPRGGAPAAPLAQTTVQPGESLWAVAKRVAPGHDPRALVMRIQELNHLEGGAVQAGQLLVLPR